MKILVTGGAGFIGSHIVDAYVQSGHRVWVVDNEYSGHRSRVNKNARFVKLDVTNLKALDALFKKNRFDVVNHHAAQIDVRASVVDPTFDARVNILGLLNVLNCTVKYKVKKILFSSSGGTVYGECKKPAPESSPERPLSPYGVAKLAGEKYIQAFHALHGLKYTIFRYSNVYGPRQDPHGEAGVVAIFSKRFLEKERAFIFGDGRQTRDFVFVGDVARANVMALKKADNQIINIGVGVETSVFDLYAHMLKTAGLSMKTHGPIRKPARTGELQRSVLAIGKARRVLGWKPQHLLLRGIADTLDYFRVRR